MNVVKIYGGLGNQLFQYAFGKVQALNGIDVSYDITNYDIPNNPPRPFVLDKFNITLPIQSFIKEQETIKETKYKFDLTYLNKQNCNFYGYWQYLPYYNTNVVYEALKIGFSIKENYITNSYLSWLEKVKKSKSISLHVRRGDYIHKGVEKFPLMPFSYYYELLNIEKEGVIFIFSDDLDWCKKVFNQDYFKRKVYFVDLPDYLCFELVKNCNINILANSTFLYWAAMFNLNKDKKVYCPKYWLGDTHIDENRYPKDWIKI